MVLLFVGVKLKMVLAGTCPVLVLLLPLLLGRRQVLGERLMVLVALAARLYPQVPKPSWSVVYRQ